MVIIDKLIKYNIIVLFKETYKVDQLSRFGLCLLVMPIRVV